MNATGRRPTVISHAATIQADSPRAADVTLPVP